MYAYEDAAPNTLWYYPKTGGLYLVLEMVEDSTNGHENTRYVAYWSFKNKTSRVRKAAEFLDGRFLPVSEQPQRHASGECILLPLLQPSLDGGPKTFPVKPPLTPDESSPGWGGQANEPKE